MRYTTAAEAVKLIRSNDSIYIQGSTSIPEVLVAALADRGEELDVTAAHPLLAAQQQPREGGQEHDQQHPDHAAQQCGDKFQKFPHFRLPPFMPTVT